VAGTWLLERMKQWRDNPAIIWRDQRVTYGWLASRVSFWEEELSSQGAGRGRVVALHGDYSPSAIALLLGLIERAAIIVPLTEAVEKHRAEFMNIAEVQVKVLFDEADRARIELCDGDVKNPLTRSLTEAGEPGLVLFTSGSTGKPKGSLHNMTRFLTKFHAPRGALRTIALPPMDHVAGLDTLFYSLSSGGVLITPSDRRPETVCRAIELHKAELLPASAAFLNLLLISQAYREFDLSSLRIVAYGSDVMPESTLGRLREAIPNAKFVQKYGTTELGSPRTRSKENGSLWMRIDSEGVETKIVDGVLWVRTRCPMLGYLNAPSPFTEDGWFNTGDAVEVAGEHIRMLGRKSEIINVGGDKVYPAEVESVLQSMEGVEEVTVSAEPNAITGQMVAARVKLGTKESLSEFRKRMRAFCQDKLESYKIPQKVILVEGALHGERFKKTRRES